jgi:hypothetical protein
MSLNKKSAWKGRKVLQIWWWYSIYRVDSISFWRSFLRHFLSKDPILALSDFLKDFFSAFLWVVDNGNVLTFIFFSKDERSEEITFDSNLPLLQKLVLYSFVKWCSHNEIQSNSKVYSSFSSIYINPVIYSLLIKVAWGASVWVAYINLLISGAKVNGRNYYENTNFEHINFESKKFPN